ncbi:MAG TPA: c-type cytochrome domain-containing protein [Candidatus Sulfotelmatobacter sp.]|nr:c-type cytochrome domain-containing protein [Candidatus Sulfotelmatobacter sp.]
MPLRVRAGILGLGSAAILLLAILLIYAPPDGRERAELAQFLGRFHPLLVHIPIALLLLVPILEGVALLQKREHLRRSAGFVLALGTAAAIATAWLGWLLAWSGSYEGSRVMRHMWGGVILAAASLACCGLGRWKRSAYAAVLVAMVGLLLWTSDQGGKLTHGDFFLSEHSPEPLRHWLAGEPPSQVDPASFYALRVQPIFQDKCVLCHNAGKFKGKLRLDTYEHVMQGGKDGPVIHPGATATSELFRRITLSPESKDFMPAEGKPALSAAEIKIIELWIAAGAPIQLEESAIQGLPPSPGQKPAAEPLTADYRPQAQAIAALESSLGVRLVPRSQNPTDGLILRTASAPVRCDDATLTQLAPVANLIVDAELARTGVTDKGMQALAGFSNLRFLDLSGTAVTSAGVREIMKLGKLESLNLTETKVTRDGVAALQAKPGLKRLYFFGTH